MTLKNNYLILAILFMFVLTACEKQSVKSNEQAELDSLAWTKVQQSTLYNLQEKNYGEATKHIIEMMELAGEDNERWEYIRMALVSMPDDIALPLIDRALTAKYIEKNAEQLYGFSRVLTQFKNNDQALQLINLAIKKNKLESYVYWRARLYLLGQNEISAEKDYIWLINKDKSNPDYIGQYATLLSYLNRDDEAIKLLSNNQTVPALLFRQIVLLFQLERDDEVVDKFQQLKELISDKELESNEYLQIGELAYWLEDYDTSLSLLQQVKSGDELSEAKLLIGRVLMEQGDTDRSIIVFNQVQNGPEDQAIPAYQFEIEILRRQDKIDDALIVVNRALGMFKNNSELIYTRAMLYERKDNIPELEKDLLGLIEMNPENADALNALGYTWADRDMNLDLAYEYIMKAHTIKPDDKAVLDSVGWVYYKKGELIQAEKYLRMAVKNNNRDIESYKHLLTVLKAQGKTDEIKSLQSQMIEQFPDWEN